MNIESTYWTPVFTYLLGFTRPYLWIMTNPMEVNQSFAPDMPQLVGGKQQHVVPVYTQANLKGSRFARTPRSGICNKKYSMEGRAQHRQIHTPQSSQALRRIHISWLFSMLWAWQRRCSLIWMSILIVRCKIYYCPSPTGNWWPCRRDLDFRVPKSTVQKRTMVAWRNEQERCDLHRICGTFKSLSLNIAVINDSCKFFHTPPFEL